MKSVILSDIDIFFLMIVNCREYVLEKKNKTVHLCIYRKKEKKIKYFWGVCVRNYE